MAWIAWRNDLYDPVGGSSAALVCQFMDVADNTDIGFYYSRAVIMKELDSKGGWIDFTGAVPGTKIDVNFCIHKI